MLFFDDEDVSCALRCMRLALRQGLTGVGLSMADGEDRTLAIGEELAAAAWELHGFDHDRWAAVTCRLEFRVEACGLDEGTLHLMASLSAKPLKARRYLPLVAHTWLVGPPVPGWASKRNPVRVLQRSFISQGAGPIMPWLPLKVGTLLDQLQP